MFFFQLVSLDWRLQLFRRQRDFLVELMVLCFEKYIFQLIEWWIYSSSTNLNDELENAGTAIMFEDKMTTVGLLQKWKDKLDNYYLPYY